MNKNAHILIADVGGMPYTIDRRYSDRKKVLSDIEEMASERGIDPATIKFYSYKEWMKLLKLRKRTKATTDCLCLELTPTLLTYLDSKVRDTIRQTIG